MEKDVTEYIKRELDGKKITNIEELDYKFEPIVVGKSKIIVFEDPRTGKHYISKAAAAAPQLGFIDKKYKLDYKGADDCYVYEDTRLRDVYYELNDLQYDFIRRNFGVKLVKLQIIKKDAHTNEKSNGNNKLSAMLGQIRTLKGNLKVDSLGISMANNLVTEIENLIWIKTGLSETDFSIFLNKITTDLNLLKDKVNGREPKINECRNILVDLQKVLNSSYDRELRMVLLNISKQLQMMNKMTWDTWVYLQEFLHNVAKNQILSNDTLHKKSSTKWLVAQGQEMSKFLQQIIEEPTRKSGKAK